MNPNIKTFFRNLFMILAGVFLLSACGKSPTKEVDEASSEADILLSGEIWKNPFLNHEPGMPDGGIKMKINPVGRSLAQVFNDSNYKHLEAAEIYGIQPISSIADAWESANRLAEVRSCREYYVDDLTHSMPFLVPSAEKLLKDIGSAFIDSLNSRGGGDYRIKVTSILRTPESVGRLQRGNANASDNSAHCYATTFDVSYAKFICDSPRMPRTQEDLKNLLAEVLLPMMANGRCYIKYEKKQGCFHITVRE